MRKREIKIPPGEAKAMGHRLYMRLEKLRPGESDSQRQAWLADEIGCSTVMVNRMVNKGAGSMGGWRAAALATNASLHYLAFGVTDKDKADADFSKMLDANMAMHKQIEEMRRSMDALRKERDQLLDQITKLRLVG